MRRCGTRDNEEIHVSTIDSQTQSQQCKQLLVILQASTISKTPTVQQTTKGFFTRSLITLPGYLVLTMELRKPSKPLSKAGYKTKAPS